MIARVTRTQQMVRLSRSPQLDERVTEEDVQDAGKLARLLMRMLKDIATLMRRFWPRRIDFEDRALGTGDIRLEHRFGGRVRWWVVDWQPATPTEMPVLERSAASDKRTLVLTSAVSGLATIRVEEAG